MESFAASGVIPDKGITMSQAFVKEPEGKDFEVLPDRPISEHPNFVTRDGLAAIERELARLDEAHAAAVRAADRQQIAHSERDRRYWTARRASAQIVDTLPDSTRVQFGSAVTIERDDGRRQRFRIVGEDEADPSAGTISHVAPLARAMFGKAVGDIVAAGDQEAEIIAVE